MKFNYWHLINVRMTLQMAGKYLAANTTAAYAN